MGLDQEGWMVRNAAFRHRGSKGKGQEDFGRNAFHDQLRDGPEAKASVVEGIPDKGATLGGALAHCVQSGAHQGRADALPLALRQNPQRPE